ncbi:MAG: PHP domain-containing protein [Eubacteriales bacterium]|nr:PHP domain-containing protein [Eubacteriales bacterium]
MYIDLHNHVQSWSPDAKQTWAEFSQGMQRAGLLGFGLSDHYDIGSYTKTGREWVFDTEEYMRTFGPERRSLAEARAKTEAAGAIHKPAFFLGMELGYLPDQVDRLSQLMAQDFDYFILSAHKLKGMDPYDETERVYGQGLPPIYSIYLQTLLEAAKRLPRPSILAHFDYISRYAPQERSKMRYKGLEGEFDSIFRYLIEQGIALELNTGTIGALIDKGYSLEEALPDRAIWERYFDLGGELVTVTTDSHKTEHHMRFVPAALKYLAELGLEHLTYFEHCQPQTYRFN